MNVEVLQSFETRAQETSTTGLLIWKDGQKIVQYGQEKKIPLYSMTKSFVSLAIGFLFDEGKIQSLDAPVGQWFPERNDWQIPPKSIVSIRMLMTHTSGISDHFIEPDGSFNLDKFTMFRQVPNVIEAAMNLGIAKPPGSHASYSNSSADILVALVNRLATMRIDAYVNKKLFEPLGITDWEWVSSTKQLFGTNDLTPSGADGLVLTASALLKVGQMVLQNGTFAGKQIISNEWIRRMSSEVPETHLTIALGEAALTNKPDPSHRDHYLPATHQGKPIPFEEYSAALFWMIPKSLADKKNSAVFMAWGFLGQYFMIQPEKKVIAIRLYSEGLPNFATEEENKRVSFADFEYWIRRLSE